MSKVLMVAALFAFGGCAPAAEEAAPAVDEVTPADAVEEAVPEAAPADTMARDTAST